MCFGTENLKESGVSLTIPGFRASGCDTGNANDAPLPPDWRMRKASRAGEYGLKSTGGADETWSGTAGDANGMAPLPAQVRASDTGRGEPGMAGETSLGAAGDAGDAVPSTARARTFDTGRGDPGRADEMSSGVASDVMPPSA